jgi:hypothetical protein
MQVRRTYPGGIKIVKKCVAPLIPGQLQEELQ